MRAYALAFVVFAAALVPTFAISFGFAWFGEPQALWLWRDVLGVL